MGKKIIFAAMAVLLLAGCGHEPDKASVGAGEVAKTLPSEQKERAYTDYPRLDAQDVLIKIGDNEIRKADVEELIALRMKVIRLGLTEAQKGFALNRGAIWVPIVASLQSTYRREVALKDWAAANGIVPDEAELDEYRRGFLRRCKAEGAKYEDFMAKNFTPAERRTAEKRIAVEATCAKANRTYLKKNPVAVKNEEIEAFLKRVVDYNASAAATNALVWAKASNLWERVKSGEDFKELAAKFTEDAAEADEQGAWGAYSLEELEKEGESELARAVSVLGAGGTTPPVESDNGLVIAHVDGITDQHGNELAGGARPFGALYELSRIFLRLPLTYEVPGKDESRKEITGYLEQKAFSEFVSGLVDTQPVEYPCGTKFFDSAKQRARMPQMLMQEGVTKEDIKKARQGNKGRETR